MNIAIRPATAYDAAYIGNHLREADVIELQASTTYTPACAVMRSQQCAKWASVAVVDDVPAVIYGVTQTDIPQVGSPWMLATDAITRIRREFIRGSRAEVDRMKSGYQVLFNRVHRDNAVSINWLRWLGFTVNNVPDGAFFQFWMRVKHV